MAGSVAPQKVEYYIAKAAPAWPFVAKDDQGKPINLIAGTTFTANRLSVDGVLSQMRGTFTILNAVQGQAEYQFTMDDVNVTGTWRMDITVHVPGEVIGSLPIVRGLDPVTFIVLASAEYIGGLYVVESNINVLEEPVSPSNPVPVIIISSTVLQGLFTPQIGGVNVSVSNPLPVTAGQVGPVAPGGNATHTTGGQDYTFVWVGTVKRFIIENQTGADVHYELDAAATVNSLKLPDGQDRFLAQPTAALHLFTAADQQINVAGGIIIRGYN